MSDITVGTEVRFSLWITAKDKRRLWTGLKRHQPVLIEFLSNEQAGADRRETEYPDVYQVWLSLEAGARNRLRGNHPAKGYVTYEYQGVTAYGARFRLGLDHDTFDPRDYLYVVPPENPMDWARTFTPRPTAESRSW